MKNADTILIIEDDFKMRRIIKDYLINSSFTVLEAENGEIGLDLFFSTSVSLVILDIMMPQIDGWFVCREIRKKSKVPIIILTARSQEDDELFGFELGADDYITKPFNPQILLARIKSLLKRQDKQDNEISFNDLIIDLNKQMVALKGNPVDLSKKEYQLLMYLIENKGAVLSREQIINRVWGVDYYGDWRVVDTNIKRLRSKLSNRFIITRRGFGYLFDENS